MGRSKLIFPGGVRIEILDDTHENVKNAFNELSAELNMDKDEMEFIKIERYKDEEKGPCTYMVIKYWPKIPKQKSAK